MPAPVASGWSGRRAGLAPAGKAPPCRGARGRRPLAIAAVPKQERLKNGSLLLPWISSVGWICTGRQNWRRPQRFRSVHVDAGEILEPALRRAKAFDLG